MPRGRSTDEYVFARNNALVEILKSCKGKQNAIKSFEIARRLGEKGFSDSASSIHLTVSKLKKERTLPILFGVKGYWWALTRTEILETINELEMRRDALQEHIDHLRQFVID